jgi:hypothetical protein
VSFLAGDKVQVDFGKFVTPIGAEVIESKDNWNYTRSIQFGWAIPFYHTGLRAALTVNDKVSLTGFLVNGWNNVKDNNDDKTFAVQAALKPSSKVGWFTTVMVGKESEESRFIVDTVLSLTASDKVSLMANLDYATEDDASWMALSLYAKLAASDSLTLSPRFEWLDDDDAFMTGTSQTLMSGTLTADFKLGGGVITRLDLRHDFSDVDFFVGDGVEVKDGQTTATIGLVYAFGGKI